MNDILYKYRSLENFKYFIDIILYNRLYASPYKELNDPMEGMYLYRDGELDEDIRNMIYNNKENLRICSLTKSKKDLLMWAHYANGHKGVAIGVRLAEEYNDSIKEIINKGIRTIKNADFNNSTAKEIFCHKSSAWKYEEEVRVFTNKTEYVNVDIVEVITGFRIDEKEERIVKELIRKINPEIRIIKQEI